MSDPMREAMTKALTENGISEGVDGLHGWRCAHPDRYGPCMCVAELLDDLTAALAPLIEARVREARAEALAEVAESLRESAMTVEKAKGATQRTWFMREMVGVLTNRAREVRRG